MVVRKHKEASAWKNAMRVVKLVYSIANRLPDIEKFGLAQQMRRAAVSVPSNIAEGYARNSSKELIQFISISLGSLSELDTQIHIALELGYLQDSTEIQSALDEAHADLVNLRVRLRDAIGTRERTRSLGAKPS